MLYIELKQIKELVKYLRKYKKIYGKFIPRCINGEPAEYSFMVQTPEGQTWHFFTGDWRRVGETYAVIRKTTGAKDFHGDKNRILESVKDLISLGL